MALHDYPAAHVETVAECALWFEIDPDLVEVRERIVRIHPLFPDSVRIIWACWPNAQDRAIVDQAWHVLRPKGRVEHATIDAEAVELVGQTDRQQ